MKRTITQSDFIDAFRDCGREDQFSYEALCALFEFFDDLDEQCDTETELDVIAICCEFSEDTESEVIENYDYPEDDWRTYLEDNTCVVGYTSHGTVIYQAF